MKDEIIIYQDEVASARLEVRIEDETVWLNRNQLATLFNRDVKTIGKHIAISLREELRGVSVVAIFATTASDGKTYNVEHYNLDMVISIGYRVKSTQGIQFRKWANNVLKEYLLKGYAINNRVDRMENEMQSIKKELGEIKLQLNTSLPAEQGIFYEGQVFDAYVLVSDIIKSARKSVILIDNFIDESVLNLMTKRGKKVSAIIYTKNISKQMELDIKKTQSAISQN